MTHADFVEQTLVVIKPDGVARGLIGDICSRFEKAGLRIVVGKIFKPSKDLLHAHYPADRSDWVEKLGQKAVDSYTELGLDIMSSFGSTDLAVVGETVRNWLVDYMFEGEVFAMVLQGTHAIEIVRKIVGPTSPLRAPAGTIRGDYGCDSVGLANYQKRPLRNLIHASGNEEEAAFEIKLWFGSEK